ncbi:DUF1543 domain-containing protein [Mucilaginibacter terrenus]|uniref:DUF1543 domain-containing protein n=1 Tax=Mucilaginibacter terrenus TaxID=2482727 RepID=A0A3E2NY49_9SPHI|nr:DUF1543 domain-containing protein [Mucilaginibacter terrenus]RFZ85946.1 DUF1543 domain-containing protein [Mucilaginibacter terrenus]
MESSSDNLKLFMILLGSKAPRRNVEQHDYFFAIASNLKELIPEMKTFWPEAGNSLHIDGWREVNTVDGYAIKVVPKEQALPVTAKRLFFINLGGYTAGKLEEQHYTVLSVQDDRARAVQDAKKTAFFKKQSIAAVKGANSHIDEKYGIDVDDIYRIEDILSEQQKAKYHIQITPAEGLSEDVIHLGYFKLDKL